MAPLSSYGGRCPYCGTEFEDKLLEWFSTITKAMGPIIAAAAGVKIAKMLLPNIFPKEKSK